VEPGVDSVAIAVIQVRKRIPFGRVVELAEDLGGLHGRAA
jgi:hypothetical protein